MEDMRRAMLDHEPQVVHFAGHGKGGSIYLEDRIGNARAIAGEALGNFLANFPTVQCVILNACYSEESGDRNHKNSAIRGRNAGGCGGPGSN